MASKNIDPALVPSQCSVMLPILRPRPVWSPDPELKMGRRLYIPSLDGGPVHIATGGPIFFVGPKAYQTTVRSLFFSDAKLLPSPCQPAFPDLYLDSSEAEDDVSDPDDGNWNEEPSDNNSTHGNHPIFSDKDYGPATFDSSSLELSDLESMGDQQISPNGVFDVSYDNFYVGSVDLYTLAGKERSLDYVLVEVEVGDEDTPNLVSWDPCSPGRKVWATRPGSIYDVPATGHVVIITASGPVKGKLFTSPGYVKAKGKDQIEEVYPIEVSSSQSLQPGDYGSAVIDPRAAKLLGHVVFSPSSAKTAYMLPMTRIIEDMAYALKLNPGQKIILEPRKYNERGVRIDRHEFVQFASRLYHENARGEAISRRNPWLERVRRIKFPQWKGRYRKNATFEQLFFALPGEIQDEVIRALDVKSAMRLRLVSRAWRFLVSLNGPAIFKQLLANKTLPALVQNLYFDIQPGLGRIEEIGHCYSLASRLANHIAAWLAEDIYLYKPRFPHLDIQATDLKIKSRMMPSLILLVHFFQQYPRSLSESLLDEAQKRSSQGFEFELNILKSYDQDAVIQAHTTMVILIWFLRLRVRPSTKFRRTERALRGYLKEPASDSDLTILLCLGGVETVVNILDIDNYSKRVSAVQRFVSSLAATKAKGVSLTGSSTPRGRWRAGPNGSIKKLSALTNVEIEVLASLPPFLPPLDHVWCLSAQALFANNSTNFQNQTPREILDGLIQKDYTEADRLYEEGHHMWHAFFDREVRSSHQGGFENLQSASL